MQSWQHRREKLTKSQKNFAQYPKVITEKILKKLHSKWAFLLHVHVFKGGKLKNNDEETENFWRNAVCQKNASLPEWEGAKGAGGIIRPSWYKGNRTDFVIIYVRESIFITTPWKLFSSSRVKSFGDLLLILPCYFVAKSTSYVKFFFDKTSWQSKKFTEGSNLSLRQKRKTNFMGLKLRTKVLSFKENNTPGWIRDIFLLLKLGKKH